MGTNMSSSAVASDRMSVSQPPSRPISFAARSSTPSFLTNDTENVVVHRDKKKKTSRFATLRKKLTKVRRQSRSLDHARAIRDLTSSWTIQDTSALVEEYDASTALKELMLQASLARPHASTLKEDLSVLYDYKYCTDVDLIYKSVCFPVHRAILSVRCPFFHSLLARYPQYGAQVPVNIHAQGVDVNMFSVLLRYLYTGEFNSEEMRSEDLELLVRLADQFGTPNPLEQDLKTLLETSVNSDALLIFSSESEMQDAFTPDSATGEVRTHKTHELRCHKAILAARSPFFRNVILRRARSGEELTEHTLSSPTCIILDESVIPRRYARVLLNAIYLDSVNLSLIIRSSVSLCSLSEVQAMVAGKSHMTTTDEAMEIYQIGQFLDFPVLSQGCEDIIAESTTVDNLISTLAWSQEPHGSTWVHRQALHFLQDEFLQVAHSPVLVELNKAYMIEAIRSDFLQAGEHDVLSAVLKWGEHQLIRRMEDREPNLLSHTAHSVSKKGIKKRDLNDIELREILVELLPHVRTDHIIPQKNEVLNNVVKRGLISVPPSHMIGDACAYTSASPWVRGKNNGMFIKPRLFLPYYEEAKAVLEEQLSECQEPGGSHHRFMHMSVIPDALYMVEDREYSASLPPPAHIPSSSSTVDIIAGTIPVPDDETWGAMKRREQELQRSKLSQRALKLTYCDAPAIMHQLRLQVVREFGLPDSTVEILQSDSLAQAASLQHSTADSRTRYRLSTSCCASRKQYIPDNGDTHRRRKQSSPSTPVSPDHSHGTAEKEPSICSDSVLSDLVPDIAMATSSLNQMGLHDCDGLPPTQADLELDLGDGNNHSTPGTLYI